MKNVLKLEHNPFGWPQPYPMPLTKGYFNGCLLTITSGPATGQSARILDYECVAPNYVAATTTTTPSRIFRFRVMAFSRPDGQALQALRVDTDTGSKGRPPELADLAGQTFVVNGRAFSGTGVGYNPLATAGQPRLNAVEILPLETSKGGFVSTTTATNYVGAELALLPNAACFNPLSATIGVGALRLPADPFAFLPVAQFQPLNTPNATTPAFGYPSYVGFGGANEGYDAADFQNLFLALQTVTPRPQGRVVHSDPSNALTPLMLEANDPTVLTKRTDFLRMDIEDVPMPSFHRPDLANFWNHRLVNYLSGKPVSPMTPEDSVRAVVQPYIDDKWNINPYAKDFTPELAALLSAIKRQVSLRPIREDHPHFDGSNPDSLPIPAASLDGLKDLMKGGNIVVPIWDVIGRWDIDNDNDGVRDSVWVDLGDPIQITEDGRRYKPLYAILCVDLDSRLNVNAHGSIADSSLPYQRGSLLDPPLAGIIETPPGSGIYTAVKGAIETGLVVQITGNAYTPQPRGNFRAGPNMAGSTAAGSTPVQEFSSQSLPRGIGYGTAEISLRPIFPIPWLNITGALDLRGNRSELTGGAVDSYKSLLVGRERLDAVAVPGRYGYEPQVLPKGKPQDAVTPGNNYEFVPFIPTGGTTPTEDLRQPDLATQIKFFDYPWRRDRYSAFGSQPDLFGRYSLGLDYTGQPFDDMAYDRNPNDTNPGNINLTPRIYPSLLTDVPYELDLSRLQRRDSWASTTNSSGTPFATPATAFDRSLDYPNVSGAKVGISDDSPYSPTDLEKVLRGLDADAGTLPSRLWDVVNDFDPLRLRDYDLNRMQAVADATFGPSNPNTPLGKSMRLAAAQQIAGINRRLVTTDSYDLPVVNQTMPGYVSEMGPDGEVGRRNDPIVANRLLNFPLTDDFQVIMAGRDGLPVTQGVTRRKRKSPISCITASGSKRGNT